MNYLHNIEKSAIRRFEYVGYGGGQVWRVRKDGCGAWEACPRAGAVNDNPMIVRGATLTKLSAALEALPSPAIDRLR